MIVPSRCAFVDQPLDRVAPMNLEPAKRAVLWPSAQVILLNPQGQIFTDIHSQPLSLTGACLNHDNAEHAIFLGYDAHHVGWFALETSTPPCPALAVDLMTLAGLWSKEQVSICAMARSLLLWLGRTRYCSGCGQLLQRQVNGAALVCRHCQAMYWPTVTPVIIVAVHDGGDLLLLGRQSSWPPQRYSVIAGFMEPGETCEQAVAREVFEETQVRLESIHYLASQPWPFPSHLMLGFTAQASPGQIPQAYDELEDARWFTRADIGRWLEDVRPQTAEVSLPSPLALSRVLIEQWYCQAI